ncbi:MAG: hypothetical protein ABGX07_09925 [Pirellulaceae bacterium]|jgi:hypothetical protein|nr:hypothetical protein [Planctomycetaceae bacterium]HIM31894.1 hypothetical protein [Planctomycetota bacterium]
MIIKRINETFIATWILVDDARKRGVSGDKFARTLALKWEFPLDLMFFKPDGRYVNKLNSFKDLRGADSTVGHPPEGRGKDAAHVDVFLRHVENHFSPR